MKRPQQRQTTLYATDRQGSLLAQLQARRSQRFAYTPFGHRPQAEGIGFNGELPDPLTGHYLLGNGYRAYNPVLMRFNSPDSLSPFGEAGPNTYTYCRNDPVNRHDPTGHLDLNWDVALGYAWSMLAFSRGIYAFHKAWPKTRNVLQGKWPKATAIDLPAVAAKQKAEAALDVTSTVVAMTQLASATLAFAGSTARLLGADARVYQGFMGAALLTGIPAFAVQALTPRIGTRLHAVFTRQYEKKRMPVSIQTLSGCVTSQEMATRTLRLSAQQIRESTV
ncbi:RHS repeat-associated core domain-containing protein [Pseudomonas sp. Leaf127]|uniref:RHS repeat-associated core domain-containing protein n=1 Tax=Pseudomonas sp. Leaf127 TaxID=1736267 RepID=UPI0009EB18E8|nr:RHS repeat-associated core domain-containing protein [Pseudomonas sp. Leaf127]